MAILDINLVHFFYSYRIPKTYFDNNSDSCLSVLQMKKTSITNKHMKLAFNNRFLFLFFDNS